MDTDRLNRWLTLGANIGVLIGIVLLIIELAQTREMTQAQTRAQISQGVVDLLTANMNDSTYADILLRGNKGEPLSELEQYQYSRHRNAFLEYHRNVVYQYQVGLYDEIEFSEQMAIIAGDLESLPGYADHWCKSRDMMPDAYVEAIEAQAAEQVCESY